MRKECKKLYDNTAGMRDYDIKDCIRKNENLQIEYSGDIMTLTPEELRSKIISTSKTFESKFNKRSYRLLGYEWNPDKVEL